jgi:hypothetical protein
VIGATLPRGACLRANFTGFFLRYALLAALLLVLSVRLADAGCGDDGEGDGAAVAAARAIAAACPCGTTSHDEYVRCARVVLKNLVLAGELARSCRKAVQKCASRSTCGRPDAVTCCRPKRDGTQRCKITTAPRCSARGGCIGVYESCCDACGPSGCATTTSTTSTTTTTTLIIPETCGNGVIEGEEWCDGDEVCEPNCTIRRFACCELPISGGGTCSADVPAFTLFANQYAVCGEFGGTFSTGSVAAAGADCAEPLPGYPHAEQAGGCLPAPDLAAPATVCCQANSGPTCDDITTASQAAIGGFVWNCLYANYPYAPVVVGTCSADGHCEPAH